MFENWQFHNEMSLSQQAYRLIATHLDSKVVVESKWVVFGERHPPRIEASRLVAGVPGYVEEGLNDVVQHVLTTTIGTTQLLKAV